MTLYPPIETLGRRICIFGPSNAGKSTLAHALSSKLAVPAIYLDVLHHLPNTDWVQRPRDEFDALHEKAIEGDSWILEGNYMRLLTQRMQRATGIIVLGTDRWSAFVRYLRRTLLQRERIGMLEGAQDRLKWDMIRFILVEQPAKRQRDLDLLSATGLPMVGLTTMRELQGLYRAWQLQG